MSAWFGYIEYVPNNMSSWPKCICLSHPVILSSNINQVIELMNSVEIHCHQKCQYSSAIGMHRITITEVSSEVKIPSLVQSLINRSGTGNLNLPTLTIEIGSLNEQIYFNWSFGSVPYQKTQNKYYYIEPIIPEQLFYLTQWESP